MYHFSLMKIVNFAFYPSFIARKNYHFFTFTHRLSHKHVFLSENVSSKHVLQATSEKSKNRKNTFLHLLNVATLSRKRKSKFFLMF